MNLHIPIIFCHPESEKVYSVRHKCYLLRDLFAKELEHMLARHQEPEKQCIYFIHQIYCFLVLTIYII